MPLASIRSRSAAGTGVSGMNSACMKYMALKPRLAVRTAGTQQILLSDPPRLG